MTTQYNFKRFRPATLGDFSYIVYRVAHDGRETSQCFDGFAQVIEHAQDIVGHLLETQSPQELRARYRAVDLDVEVRDDEARTTACVLWNAQRFDLESLLGHDCRMAYLVGHADVVGLLREYHQAVDEYERGNREMQAPVYRPSAFKYKKSQHLDLCGMSNLMGAMHRAGMVEVAQ